ncbi:MAG: hypothetical protein H6837_20020 [Planctomycetes bacterium]|nr:hypothetical protein [Planctomycetota bacterium]
MRGGVLLVVLLIVLAAIGVGVWAGLALYLRLDDPEYRMGRAHAAVASARDVGPGTEIDDATCPVRRLIHARAKSRVDFEAVGEGRLLTQRMVHYIETDGQPGRQAAEQILGKYSVGPVEPEQGQKRNWLQGGTGYGRDPSLDRRCSLEAWVDTRGADDKRANVLVQVGPGIDLSASVPPRWRVLWLRVGGPTLRWRADASALELELVGVPAERVQPLEVAGRPPIPFRAGDQGRLSARVPREALAPLAAAGIRTRIHHDAGKTRMQLVAAPR